MEEAKKRIVVDTNIIFSSLIKEKGFTRGILVILKNQPDVELFAPKQLIDEVNKHKYEISRRVKLPVNIFDQFLQKTLSGINFVDIDVPLLKEAENYVNQEEDAPFVAACFRTGSNILLTYNIKDYKKEELAKKNIEVLKPGELLEKVGIEIKAGSKIKRKGFIWKIISAIFFKKRS